MAREFQRFPRLKFTAYDEAGNVLGDVVAKNEHEALERASATYTAVERVDRTDYAGTEKDDAGA